MSGNGWHINADGDALFNKIHGTVNGGSLIGEGITINMCNSTSGGGGGGGGGGLSSINPDKFQVGKNQTLTDFMNKLAQGVVSATVGDFDFVAAKKMLTVGLSNASWSYIIKDIGPIGVTVGSSKDSVTVSVCFNISYKQALCNNSEYSDSRFDSATG
jgi:hypothetical protein